MIMRLRTSWFIHTLVGRLTALCAVLIVLLGVCAGIIWALSRANTAIRQSQSVCSLAYDLSRLPTTDKSTVSLYTIIRDGRVSFHRSNCTDAGFPQLPPPIKQVKDLLPAGVP